ncbi:MAG: tetratricopeptide repeat protein [Bacteroidota bacterium]
MISLFITLNVSANFIVNENCISAYNKIISLRIEEGKALIEKEKVANPTNDMICYLEDYIDFITLFVSENEKDYNRLKGNLDKRLVQLKNSDANSPFYLYTRADVYLHWAIIRIKFKEYLTAAIEIKKAFNLLEENRQRFPWFKANNKGLGFLHAIAGAIPENYKWLAKMVGIKGTIKQGVGELKELLEFVKTSDYKFMHDEVFFILVLVEWNLQKDEDEASKLLQNTDFANTDNPFLLLAKANIAMKTGHNDDAIQMLMNRPKSNDLYPYNYLDFMTGVAKLNRLDVDAADYFQTFIQHFNGKNYIKAAWQKLAWIALINKDSVQYKSLIKNCIGQGDDGVDEDKEAMKEAMTNEQPNVMLLKARLLCDGGYYDKSIASIAGMKSSDFKKFKDQLEVTYRMGRIYHLMGDHQRATEYYQKTLQNGSTSSYYFAANSALQIGLINEKLGNKTQAIQYYKSCLKLRNHDYQNSIDQKAEAGLDRMEAK